MRALVSLFACSALFALGYVGCTSDNNGTQNLVTNGAGVGGSPVTGYPSCNGNKPDNYCNGKGANPETCDCPDCVLSAMCTSKCTDNGACDYAGGEDCTCSDCYAKQGPVKDQFDGCPPFSVGCDGDQDEENICTAGKDCTCSVCQGDARCTSCDNNGSCVPYIESCDCADCKVLEACGGNGSQSASSAAASTADATSAASSTSAGAGGSPGAGGAGGSPAGAGGAGGN